MSDVEMACESPTVSQRAAGLVPFLPPFLAPKCLALLFEARLFHLPLLPLHKFGPLRQNTPSLPKTSQNSATDDVPPTSSHRFTTPLNFLRESHQPPGQVNKPYGSLHPRERQDPSSSDLPPLHQPTTNSETANTHRKQASCFPSIFVAVCKCARARHTASKRQLSKSNDIESQRTTSLRSTCLQPCQLTANSSTANGYRKQAYLFPSVWYTACKITGMKDTAFERQRARTKATHACVTYSSVEPPTQVDSFASVLCRRLATSTASARQPRTASCVLPQNTPHQNRQLTKHSQIPLPPSKAGAVLPLRPLRPLRLLT